jgi:hypothetical protein
MVKPNMDKSLLIDGSAFLMDKERRQSLGSTHNPEQFARRTKGHSENTWGVTFPHKGRPNDAKGRTGKSMNDTKNRQLW